MPRTRLHTVRLSPREQALVAQYLTMNSVFDSFSSLARIATMTFIGQQGTVELRPATVDGPASRPRFLWDYDLTQAQVQELLSRPGLPAAKQWLIARILAEARFEEVFRYLTLDEIRRALPHLRLSPPVARRWAYAIERWSRHG